MHHCTAEMIVDVEPAPDEFIAFTPTRAAPGATPRYAALPSPCPARIADTCVPCPLSSYGDVRPLTKSFQPITCPWLRSTSDNPIPVSITPRTTPLRLYV